MTSNLRGELGLLGTGGLLQPGPELLCGSQRGGGPHQELPVSTASGCLGCRAGPDPTLEIPSQGLTPDQQTQAGHGPFSEREQGGEASPSSQETRVDTAQWDPGKSSGLSVPKFPQWNVCETHADNTDIPPCPPVTGSSPISPSPAQIPMSSDAEVPFVKSLVHLALAVHGPTSRFNLHA